MGQCYGKTNPSPENDTADVTAVIPGSGDNPPPSATPGGTPSVKSTPARTLASPWRSPYPHGGGVTPSPARTSAATPRRIFRRPFPPPSPAKHIRASLAKRLGRGAAARAKEGTIPEEGVAAEEKEEELDKRFGYGKNFGAKYEIGKEVGKGHFGHTCYARCKKGELKDQPVAVKIISKSKVQLHIQCILVKTTSCTIKWGRLGESDVILCYQLTIKYNVFFF